MKIDLKTARIAWSQIPNGIDMWALFDKNFASPAALIWGIGTGEAFFLTHAYTLPYYRRQGACKAICAEIIKHYPAILTGTGELSILTGLGFKWCDDANQFVIKRII